MARTKATQIDNNFIQGLITETTALRFPENAVTESDNVIFGKTGEVTRRLGFDIESDAAVTNVTEITTKAVSEFLWASVTGVGSLTFLVAQVGNILYFYDVSSSLNVTTNKKSFTIDLDSHKVTGTSKVPAEEVCSFASGFGDLFVANAACETIYISYNSSTDSITATNILLKARDFEGLDDTLANSARLTETVTTLVSNNPEHYYNIINQGWHTGDALSQWDAARTDMPSNIDAVGLYRASSTDAFNNSIVTSIEGFNTLAPKGHFILDAVNPNRKQALIDEGFSTVTFGSSVVQVAQATGSTIGDMTAAGGLAAAFDSTTTQSSSNTASSTSANNNSYIGKNFSSSPKVIQSVKIYGSSNNGYSSPTPLDQVTLSVYAKNGSAPTSYNDGTLLGFSVFITLADESTARTIISTDAVTEWDYAWVYVHTPLNKTKHVAEIEFFTTEITSTGLNQDSKRRAEIVEFFASRVFYSGVDETTLSDKIFFSRIIRKQSEYDECYQSSDPTSEDISSLLPDDGGVIRIPDIGKITALFGLQSSLLVLATNGVWIISGSGGAAFSASDFQIRKLSSRGANSPNSVVDVKGIPVWWGVDGIFTVQFNPEFNSFSVSSLTDATIKQEFLNIPVLNRRFAKGSYDIFKNEIIWIFNDDASLVQADYYTYNRILVYNSETKAFFLSTIQDSVPKVSGIVWASDSLNSLTPLMKYTCVSTDAASTENIFFGELRNSSYQDWTTFAGSVSMTAADEKDYTSYFITGYKLHGDAQRKFQSNYVFTYFKDETNASCFMQGIFDFTTAKTGGRWSTKQQVYPTLETIAKGARMSRRKVRGNGISLQLRYESLTGKPFTLLGWSLLDSINNDV